MPEFSPVMIGVAILVAGAAIGVTALLSPKSRAAFVYAQLVLMSGIYVGLAIASLDAAEIVQRSNWSALMLESLIAIGFVTVGLGVLTSSKPWLLGALILLHGVVDLGHLLFGFAHGPAWYAFMCVIYDGMVGVAAIWLLSERSAHN